MKPSEVAKAFGTAVAILVLNVLIAIVAVVVYSVFIEPGHSREFYDAAALRIAPWCSHIAGTALFFGAGYVFGRHRPARRGLVFAAAVTFFYAIVDSASVGFAGFFATEFALSIAAKLAASLAGTALAARIPADQRLRS